MTFLLKQDFFNSDHKAVFQINQGSGVKCLAVLSRVNGYLEGDIYERKTKLEEWKKISNGHNAIVTTTNKGIIILSEVLLEKGNIDQFPISF